MKKHLMIGATLLTVISLLFFGCVSSPEETDILAIDVVYPFSQEYSASFKNGIQLAAQEINDQGGILKKNIEITYHDDGDTTNKAVELAAMIAEKPGFPIVIGHRSSDDVLKVASIYDRGDKLLFSPIIANSKVSLRANQGAYLCAPPEEMMAKQMVESMAAQDITKVAIIHTAASTYGKDYLQKVEEYGKKAGIEIVDAVSYLPNLDYFTYYVKKWDGLGAQAIVSACVKEDIPILYDFLAKTNNSRPIFATYDMDIRPFILPENIKKQSQVTSFFDNRLTRESPAIAFIKAYQKAYGQDPDLPAAQAYLSMQLAAKAVNQANSLETKAIEKVLAENSFDSLYGSIKFDQRLIQGIPIVQKVYLNNQLVVKDNQGEEKTSE